MNQFQRTFFLINRKFSIFESALIHRKTHGQALTLHHILNQVTVMCNSCVGAICKLKPIHTIMPFYYK